MDTSAQIVQKLTDVKATLVKVATETATLIEKIAALQAAVDAGTVTQEISDAVKAVSDQANVVDALVPDAPTTPPA